MNEFSEKDGFVVELPEPPKPPPAEGITPEKDVSVSTRPPLAAATPDNELTFATSLAGSVAEPGSGCSTLRAICLAPPPGGAPPKPRSRCGPTWLRVAVLVTVMSVPTP